MITHDHPYEMKPAIDKITVAFNRITRINDYNIDDFTSTRVVKRKEKFVYDESTDFSTREKNKNHDERSASKDRLDINTIVIRFHSA